MNPWMDVQARFCDLINTFPSLLDQKNTFESQNIMGLVTHKSPKTPRSVRIPCRARTACKYRLMETFDGHNAVMYVDAITLVVFSCVLLICLRKTGIVYCYNKSPASKFQCTLQTLGGRYQLTGMKDFVDTGPKNRWLFVFSMT